MANPFLAPPAGATPPLRVALNYLAVCVLVVVVFWVSLSAIDVTFNFGFIGKYWRRILDGFVLTIELSVMSLIISLVLGALLAVGQGVRLLVVRSLCDLYVKVIRGTPLMAQIYLFYYIIGQAWGINNRIVAGVLILSIFEGAYIAEIIRGSLLSLDRTQLESA
ncbi:MAG: ABC transporter permease subunit, partial [Actinomycetia bacterium]|nr:ABC transporter permease subunit [Actinomycetes bacterium]